ncbi:hypothetical protein DFP74_2106 [Nocardiopsis sp. Huas11]|uniref:hypothetical protein n=1 Tax=Nocardiopsis sp. Huas11 TaxID=2183912 RepID=UPI000EAE6FB2|nr:hypothetical protein [Nocardiopsis sp. Huas11]RKS06474.1 hypothetical protein DFP74_2106 [Nocardiopsis sp. Huas11]
METPKSQEKSRRLPRRFSLFWLGSTGSNLADGIMMTALPMAAAVVTNDPLLVAGLTVMRFLPVLVFGVAAGVIVDRYSPVRPMVAANITRAAFLAPPWPSAVR